MNHNYNFIIDLLPKLDKQGWRYRLGKHMVLYPADKNFPPLTISLTPSDQNARRQAMRQLIKSGFKT